MNKLDWLLTTRPVRVERGLSGSSKDRRKQYRKYQRKYGVENVDRCENRVWITGGAT
jgi:hypothetical protein